MRHVVIRVGTVSTILEIPHTGKGQHFAQVAAHDVDGLIEAGTHYGESWNKRGGSGFFHMLARKWDRLEVKMEKEGFKPLLQVIAEDKRAEGAIDDTRDLRRYLMLGEAKLIENGVIHAQVEKGEAHKLDPTGDCVGGFILPGAPDIAAAVNQALEPKANGTTKHHAPTGFKTDPTLLRVACPKCGAREGQECLPTCQISADARRQALLLNDDSKADRVDLKVRKGYSLFASYEEGGNARTIKVVAPTALWMQKADTPIEPPNDDNGALHAKEDPCLKLQLLASALKDAEKSGKHVPDLWREVLGLAHEISDTARGRLGLQ